MNQEATKEGYCILHDLVINCSLEKVFEGITSPEHLVNWWPLKCTGRPVEGEIYNFNFTEDYNWFGKVAQVEKDKSFQIKMTQSDADWDPTSFGFELEKIEHGVWVKFWHKDWPSCNDHFRRSSFCWAILLKGLKDYLEKGIIVAFEDRE